MTHIIHSHILNPIRERTYLLTVLIEENYVETKSGPSISPGRKISLKAYSCV